MPALQDGAGWIDEYKRKSARKPIRCTIGWGRNSCQQPVAFAIIFKAAPEKGAVYVCREHRHALLTEGYCVVHDLRETTNT